MRWAHRPGDHLNSRQPLPQLKSPARTVRDEASETKIWARIRGPAPELALRRFARGSAARLARGRLARGLQAESFHERLWESFRRAALTRSRRSWGNGVEAKREPQADR